MEIAEIKKVLLNVFVVLTVFTVFFFLYNFYKPVLFQGLTKRLVWVLLSLGLINIFLHIPYRKLILKLSGIQRHILGGQKSQFRIESLYEQEFELQKRGAREIINLLFQILLALFLVFLLIRHLYPDMIKSILDMNYFLLTVVISGIITVLFGPEKTRHIKKKPGYFQYIAASITGLVGMYVVWLKISDMGLIGIAMSVTAGVLIVPLSVLLMREQETAKRVI